MTRYGHSIQFSSGAEKTTEKNLHCPLQQFFNMTFAGAAASIPPDEAAEAAEDSKAVGEPTERLASAVQQWKAILMINNWH